MITLQIANNLAIKLNGLYSKPLKQFINSGTAAFSIPGTSVSGSLSYCPGSNGDWVGEVTSDQTAGFTIGQQYQLVVTFTLPGSSVPAGTWNATMIAKNRGLT
jgi:hypothetical protein